MAVKVVAFSSLSAKNSKAEWGRGVAIDSYTLTVLLAIICVFARL